MSVPATASARASTAGGSRARHRSVTPGAELSPGDLGELLARFNEATAKLQTAHETLTGEVARLEKELRGANRQLRRARQLAALGEMAAGMAHEIRNPLGSIKLYAKLLVEDLGDRPAQREVAVKIAGAVDRLNAVVGDVLTFSREVGARRERLDVACVIEGAIESCRDLVDGWGVRVGVEGAAGAEVDADPTLLSQALVNVIRNACEAMEESGAALDRREVVIRVERRRVLDAEGRRRDATSIAVIDRGPGVPDGVIPRIFNPFFTTRHTGTGLGLAIVHRIVDAHEGSVSVRNNPAERGGATVELVIPDRSEKLPAARTAAGEESAVTEEVCS